jgi:restriction system protein
VPIPDFQTFMLPLLEFAADGKIHSMAEAREYLAKKYSLSEAERAELLPSAKARRFDNRVAWAKVHLTRAGLLVSPEAGRFLLSEAGREVLGRGLERVDLRLLASYPAFMEWRRRGPRAKPAPDPAPEVAGTPEEVVDNAFQTIREKLVVELLERVKASTPSFFEQLVVELLLKMGYGGNRAEAGRAIGASGDEGIDGVISEDRLGLDTIYVQAKRWEGTVGRPEIQKFVGALHGKRARKGVFLTTGVFSAEAEDYVSRIDPRVVLIDGTQLAEYMIDFGLGVSTRAVYELKRIDSDYFEGDA